MMEIITLIQKQKGLECEVAELKRHIPLKDRDESMRHAGLLREVLKLSHR